MSNVDAVVELIEEAERPSVKVGDDLDHNATYSCGVHGLKRIRTATKMENAELTQQQNQTFFSIVGHFLQAVVDVASLFQHGKARVIDVSALLLVGRIGLRDAFGQFVKTLDKPVKLLLSGLDDVLHGFVDAEAGKQHGAVGRCRDDAHFLQSRKAVVSVESRCVEFLGQLGRLHFWTGSEDHDRAYLSLVQPCLKQQLVPHQPSPRTWEMSARILATCRRGRNNQS